VQLQSQSLIHSAALHLRGATRVVTARSPIAAVRSAFTRSPLHA
jgi:hypothetical protein